MALDTKRRVRVLAADDSAVMREVLRMVFQMHASAAGSALPRMELCGVVKDGIEALEAVRTLRPDVLLLDVEMPRLGGLGVLEHLKTMGLGLPVIMCSSHTARGARVTLDALSCGAKDYVMKPAQQSDFAMALDSLMTQLLPKIAELVAPVAMPLKPVTMPSAGPPGVSLGACVELIVIGVSTGGPSALETMLPRLPRSLPVPVMIVQHMPKLFTEALANRLDRVCAMPVMQAEDGMPVQAGRILLAAGGAHMEVARGAGKGLTVKLHQGPALNSCKPSVDYLFRSSARICGSGTLAVVMTGMGSDGLDGARAVAAAGGAVLAQDAESSAVWGMPGRIVEEGLATATLPLQGLAEALMRRVESGRTLPRVNPAAGRAGHKEAAYGVL